MDNGIQRQIDHCFRLLHFEMMSNSNWCQTKASDLSSMWCCCRNCCCNCLMADREQFAQMLCSKRMTVAGTNADAIDANCWQSIWLHSTGPTGCHFHLKKRSTCFEHFESILLLILNEMDLLRSTYLIFSLTFVVDTRPCHTVN